MQLELTLKRDGGTLVDMVTAKYHFTPNDAGDHVCEVADPAHIKRLLSIDGYGVYLPDAVGETQAWTAPAARPVVTRTIAQIDDGLLSASDPQADPGDEDDYEGDDEDLHSIKARLIDAPDETDEIDETAPAPADDLESLSNDDLRARFTEVLGRSPHPQAKAVTMIGKIREAATA